MQEHLHNRSMRERAAKFEADTKKVLMEWLEANGGELVLDEPIDFVTRDSKGKRKEKRIAGARRTERTQQSLNEDRAMELIKGREDLGDCIKTIEVVDEDALLAAMFEGRVDDLAVKKLYDNKTTYAFNLIEGGDDEEEE